MNKILELVIWDLTTHKRNYLLQAIGALGLTLAMVLIPWLASGFQPMEIDSAGSLIMVFQITAFAVYLTLLSAPLDGKQHRISYLMLPASMTQKFISRLIIVLVLVPLTLMAITLITDGVYFLLTMLMTPGVSTSSIFMETWRITKSVIMPGKYFWIATNHLITFMAIVGTVLIFVCYGLMCGALWTKRAFLKSIVLGFLIMIVCSLAIGCIGFLDNAILDSIGMVFKAFSAWDITSDTEMIASFFMLFVIYSIDFTMLSIGYRAFSKRQVVDKGILTKYF